MEVKPIDANTTEFTANGRKYKVYQKISIDRYMEFQKLSVYIAFGMSITDIRSNNRKLYALINSQKFADAAVLCNNIDKGLADIDNPNRVHYSLMVAALVINFEGEDQRVYDEHLLKSKIADWQAEGLDMLGFISLSRACIQGLSETLLTSTQKHLQNLSFEITKEE